MGTYIMGKALFNASSNQAACGVMKAKHTVLKTGDHYEMCYQLHNGDPGAIHMKAVKVKFTSENSNIIVLREHGATKDVSYIEWQDKFTFTEIDNPDVTPLGLITFKALFVNHPNGMSYNDIYDILLNGNYIKGCKK